jgi:hypothetical protein
VPGKEIAAAAIAKVVEAHFDAREPTRIRKAASGSVLHGGMRTIQQLVELGSAPTEIDAQRSVERFREPRQRTDRQALELPAFDTGHRVAR